MLSKKLVVISIILSSVVLSVHSFISINPISVPVNIRRDNAHTKYGFFSYKVNAIRCYQCSSLNDTECHDLSSYRPHLTAAFFRECDDFQKYGNSTPFCRKTSIEILLPHQEIRTTRSCGWIQHHRTCYKADNDDHLETSCQCFEDGCNGSSQVPMIGAVSLLIFSFFCFKF